MVEPELPSSITVAVRSIGCRTNQEEMTTLSARLAEEGFRLVDATGDAQIIIVNTCSVTGATESKTRRFLKTLSESVPQAKICVTGCLAQQDAETLLALKGVSWVVGNLVKNSIPQLLRSSIGGIHTIAPTGPHSCCPAPHRHPGPYSPCP